MIRRATIVTFLTVALVAATPLRASTTVSFRSSDGVELSAAWTPPASTAPAVLLVHSLSRTHQDWDTTAEALTGAELKVPSAEVGPLPERTYYRHDLVGCEVRDEGGGVIGTVARVDGPLERSHLVIDGPRGEACIAAMRPVAESRGVSVAQVALAWLLHRRAVTSVIVGAKRLDQLEDNIAATRLSLTDAELDALDAVSVLPPEYPGWMFERQNARAQQLAESGRPGVR